MTFAAFWLFGIGSVRMSVKAPFMQITMHSFPSKVCRLQQRLEALDKSNSQCWYGGADDGLLMDVCTLPDLRCGLPPACDTQRHPLVPVPLLLQLLLGTVWAQCHHLVAAWRAVPH